MNDAIRDDVQSQVEGFVQRVRLALDPARYPRLADGACFDATLAALNAEFSALQRLFHDYLLAAWSEETATALREAAAAATARPAGGTSRERKR